ncbi:SHOCT domain-containing protein [Gracilibacillus oryzae]|uniref:SHOCT domain-containing protein n=1 Tax=Gracilibacillus oryzae TaxID=1672701 RepID=A0A7C8KSZ5_9BACI|nr:SHOCT domain-containing protein [Gracilibacillus oryzae]KAB8139130.1 SHOCT domain-containing protein [Gracilibacillus oryzae]
MHFMHGYGSYWPMILMMIIWLGLIILGVLLVANFIRGGSRKNPQKIIKERLAKGEIDEEEYEQLKSILKK